MAARRDVTLSPVSLSSLFGSCQMAVLLGKYVGWSLEVPGQVGRLVSSRSRTGSHRVETIGATWTGRTRCLHRTNDTRVLVPSLNEETKTKRRNWTGWQWQPEAWVCRSEKRAASFGNSQESTRVDHRSDDRAGGPCTFDWVKHVALHCPGPNGRPAAGAATARVGAAVGAKVPQLFAPQQKRKDERASERGSASERLQKNTRLVYLSRVPTHGMTQLPSQHQRASSSALYGELPNAFCFAGVENGRSLPQRAREAASGAGQSRLSRANSKSFSGRMNASTTSVRFIPRHPAARDHRMAQRLRVRVNH